MADIKIATQVDTDNPVAGDLYLENGTARLTQSLKEEAGQWLYIALRLFRGEWFLDPAQGVPYYQVILGLKTPLPLVQQIFTQLCRKTPGLASLDQIAVVPVLGAPRTAKLNFQLTLTDGTILKSSDFAPLILGGA